MATKTFTIAEKQISIEHADNWVAAVIVDLIFKGETYPIVDGIPEPETILDIGANVGAATLWFAANYPNAQIHAVEPAKANFDTLTRNTKQEGNVTRHNLALGVARSVSMFPGVLDGATSSVVMGSMTSDAPVEVPSRRVGPWLRANSITDAQIIKIDTEGMELPIMRQLGTKILNSAAVIHVEFHSENDRRSIDRMLATSHSLFSGHIMTPHRGELTYLRLDLAETSPTWHEEIRSDQITDNKARAGSS